MSFDPQKSNIILTSEKTLSWKHTTTPRLITIKDGEASFNATIIPHNPHFISFLEKNTKENPNYSLLKHHSDYEEFLEFLEMERKFKERETK